MKSIKVVNLSIVIFFYFFLLFINRFYDLYRNLDGEDFLFLIFINGKKGRVEFEDFIIVLKVGIV